MGFSVPPTAAVAATAEPEMEPNIIFARRSHDQVNQNPTNHYPGEVNQTYRNTAAVHQRSGKDEKGIANRAKLSSPLASRCETVIAAISCGNIKSIEATVAIPIENEMGTPIKTSTKNSQIV